MPEKPKTTPATYVETAEQKRLNDAREADVPWKKWGPNLSFARLTASDALQATSSHRSLMSR